MHTMISQLHNPMYQPKSDWMTVEDNEPEEVKELKKLLANIECRCKSCDRYYFQNKRPPQLASSSTQVQADLTDRPVKRFVQAHPSAAAQTPHSTIIISEDVCPTCTVTLDILRGGLTKICKDEESETVQTMISCDKSTCRSISSVERATSMTSKIVDQPWKPSFSDLFTSKVSSGTSFALGSSFKSSRVRFTDVSEEDEPRTVARPLKNLKCTCLESFIDAIRPPLIGF